MTKPDESLKLAGRTQLRATRGDRSHAIENGIRLFVDLDKARIEIDGLPIGNLPPSFWEWDDESVIRALRWVAEALEKQAYASRPIQTLFVESKLNPPTDPQPTDIIPCPACAGEAWMSCSLCDGVGRVVRRDAQRWRRANS